MIALDAESFHRTMAETPLAACVLHPAGVDPAAVLGAAKDPPAVWAALDIDAAPEIAAMFGAPRDAATLLVMRERVVVLLRRLDPARAAETRALVARAAALDMAAARRAMEAEALGREALRHRRACPTTWRMPG